MNSDFILNQNINGFFVNLWVIVKLKVKVRKLERMLIKSESGKDGYWFFGN